MYKYSLNIFGVANVVWEEHRTRDTIDGGETERKTTTVLCYDNTV